MNKLKSAGFISAVEWDQVLVHCDQEAKARGLESCHDPNMSEEERHEIVKSGIRFLWSLRSPAKPKQQRPKLTTPRARARSLHVH